MGRRGKREYVQVLRLLETFSQQEVAKAAKDALRLGALSFDAVKHLVLCRLEGRPPRLDLELYPYLPTSPGERHVRRGLPDLAVGESGMNHRSTLLLEHHLKELKLPSILREYGKMAAQCAAEGVDHPQYLLRLAELELIDRHQRMVERRIRAARCPRRKKPGQLRLPGHPVAEQGTGDGTGPLRIHPAPGERHRRRQTAAPARPTWPWDWVWPPASEGCQWASPRQPPWCTS